MGTEVTHIKLRILLDAEDWHELTSEGIWAEVVHQIEHKLLLKICNIPFFAKNFAIGDEVLAVMTGDEARLEAITGRSGHSTFRIFMSEPDKLAVERLNLLNGLGCEWEFSSFRGGALYAVDVPRNTDIRRVYRLLAAGEHEKLWRFDVGHIGHSDPKDETFQIS